MQEVAEVEGFRVVTRCPSDVDIALIRQPRAKRDTLVKQEGVVRGLQVGSPSRSLQGLIPDVVPVPNYIYPSPQGLPTEHLQQSRHHISATLAKAASYSIMECYMRLTRSVLK